MSFATDRSGATIAEMKRESPPFTQKLARLMSDKTAREVSEAAGINEQAIYDLLTKGSVPRAYTCVRLARALGVSVAWLVDDDAPVDQPQTDAERLDDLSLVKECARRYRLDLLSVLEALEAAENVESWSIAKEAFSKGLSKDVYESIPDSLKEATLAHFYINLWEQKWQPDNVCFEHHADLPGSDRPPEDMLPAFLRKRADALFKKEPGLLWLRRYMDLMEHLEMFPTRREHYERQMSKFAAEIERRRAPDPLDDVSTVDSSTFAPGSGQAMVWRERAMARRDRMKSEGFNL